MNVPFEEYVLLLRKRVDNLRHVSPSGRVKAIANIVEVLNAMGFPYTLTKEPGTFEKEPGTFEKESDYDLQAQPTPVIDPVADAYPRIFNFHGCETHRT